MTRICVNSTRTRVIFTRIHINFFDTRAIRQVTYYSALGAENYGVSGRILLLKISKFSIKK
jgi:hypothetical protein